MTARPPAMSPEPIPLEVIHEDEHVIVVVKQPGMLVPSNYERKDRHAR